MIDIIENASLLHHNTFGMNVKSHILAEYDNLEDLHSILEREDFKNRPLLHIGSGSNLLFTADFDGIVLHSRMKGIHILDQKEKTTLIEVESGVLWDDFCVWAIEHNLGGTENLSGIPGEVGASAVQNIGAYGAEVANIIEEVHVVEVKTGQKQVFRQADCKYGYRSSIFKQENVRGLYIVTSVVFALTNDPQPNVEYSALKEAMKGQDTTIQNIRQAVLSVRNSKLPDPKVQGNAGSFFMNPVIDKTKFAELIKVYPFMPFYEVDAKQVKIPAAWLIDQCGWKGRMIGGAAVYEKQCLVLVNRKGATPEDVISLSQSIIRTIKDRYDIEIKPEVNII